MLIKNINFIIFNHTICSYTFTKLRGELKIKFNKITSYLASHIDKIRKNAKNKHSFLIIFPQILLINY